MKFLFFLMYICIVTTPVFAKIERVFLRPSFNCETASASLDKKICTSKQTATYDAVLNYVYTKLMDVLPAVEKEKLKNTQRLWIKNERKSAFKTYRKFGEKSEDLNWDTLDIVYKERTLSLFGTYKKQCEMFLIKELSNFKTESEIPPVIKYSIFYYLYSLEKIPEIEKCKHENCYGSYGERPVFYMTNESKLLPLRSGKWIALARNAEINDPGPCDGLCRFFLIEPAEAKLITLLIEKEEVVQGYFVDFEENEDLILGDGGGCDALDGKVDRQPENKKRYHLDEAEKTLILR